MIKSPYFKFFFVVLLSAIWLWNLTNVPIITVDDAFIFLQFARNLVDHGTLSWSSRYITTDGFTSFTHLLWIAVVYAFRGGDIATSAWYANQFLGFALLALLFTLPLKSISFLRNLNSASFFISAVSTTTCMGLSATFAYWVHSLMDVPTWACIILLTSFLFAHLMVETEISWLLSCFAGISFSVLGLCRPEGTILAGILVFLLLIRSIRAFYAHRIPRILRIDPPLSPSSRISLLPSIGISVMIVGGYILWHYNRYDYVFPNPVYLKTEDISWEGVKHGLRYVSSGPFEGTLPLTFVRERTMLPPEYIPNAIVRDAIVPEHSSRIWISQLGFGGFLFLLSFITSLWSSKQASRFVRYILTIPLIVLCIVIAAGGDDFYGGWRMILPLLPPIFAAWTISIFTLNATKAGKCFSFILVLGLIAFCSRTIFIAMSRPSLCESVTPACGFRAFTQWPTSLRNYTLDISNAREDNEFVSAVNSTFRKDIVVGQSDFLRGALLFDGQVIDLSGLVNESLSHRPGQSGVSAFSWQLVTDYSPGIFISCCSMISQRNAADFSLSSMEGQDLVNFRPQDIDEHHFHALLHGYTTASVKLSTGQFYNFVIRKNLCLQALSRDFLRCGPIE